MTEDIFKIRKRGDLMLIQKAYKFRIYPTKEQETLIAKTIGCSRFVYNYFLARWNDRTEILPLWTIKLNCRNLVLFALQKVVK